MLREVVIRRITESDIEATLLVWRESCVASHSFLSTEFLKKTEMEMRSRTLLAHDTDVVDADGVCAFMSRIGTFVNALFVAPTMQCRGIGKQLLDHAKSQSRLVELSVFAQNPRAVRFYQREGFWATAVKEHRETGENIVMLKWEMPK